MRVLFTVALFAEAVWALTTCPATETAYTGSTGAKYAICTDTDLQGPTLRIFANTASAQACAANCDADGQCIRAVYDTQTKDCHIKDNGANLNWVSNGRFDVIRLNNALKEGTVIANCPFKTTSYVSPGGTQFQICPDTDYRGASEQMINNVANENACAQICGTTQGCAKAVFDTVNKVCHIKALDPDATLIWALNKQFTVIQTFPKINPAVQGNWSDFVRLPVIPVGIYVVPAYPDTTRLLAFSAWGADTFGGGPGYTQFTDYNFKTGAVSQRTVSNTQHDMFCPGMSVLEDGRMMITGGSNAEVTSFYNPSTNAFSRGPDMKIPRGYHSSVTLSNGKVFTIGGCYSGGITGQDQGVPYKNGEVFDPKANTWTVLNGCDVKPMLTTDHEGPWRTDNHAWLYAWKNGSVFQAGPSPDQHWYGTTGTGSTTFAGRRPEADDQMCGVQVMYEPGKILSAGGSTDYTDSPAVNMAHITTIGEPGQPSQIERVADMKYARGFANAVVLPDGTVFVTGGQKRSLVFTDTDGAMAPELFDPKTRTWTTMAREAVPRNYHSASVLLPDGRVWSGGGGLCYVGGPGNSDAGCNKQVDHSDGQSWSAPKLLNADGSSVTRPVINNISASTAKVGSTFTVSMSNNNAATFVLIRIGSATHSINTDQRRIPVTSTRSGTRHTLQLPNDSGILIPGAYYVFALTSNGVWSVAKTIRVTL